MGHQPTFGDVPSVGQNIADLSLDKRYWPDGQDISLSNEGGHTLTSRRRADTIPVLQ